ncbi:hypothetical protein XELAEV_18041343mg [Xenopus laevis]|uniref:Uncharacterized protein n=1 Tax=Xenopus laevis TaxID=8355 RepID=A0A974H5F7_XENLA|nr:hypothetical protein XELAEV_18041343mg [Xenopus laevis]
MYISFQVTSLGSFLLSSKSLLVFQGTEATSAYYKANIFCTACKVMLYCTSSALTAIFLQLIKTNARLFVAIREGKVKI